jgi:DNA-binding NarL/FixJ family response regulator
MREYLETMLSEIPGITVVGHAVDELGAIGRIDALLPDVVTLDLSLHTGSGLEVLKNIKEHHAAIKVMVLTNYTDEFYVNRCMSAGADYFFDKSFQFMQARAVFWELAHPGRADDKPVTLQ